MAPKQQKLVCKFQGNLENSHKVATTLKKKEQKTIKMAKGNKNGGKVWRKLG